MSSNFTPHQGGLHLTPMQVCRALIGKPELIAQAAGVGAKSAFAWQRPAKWRDAGDIPSARQMRALLDWAAANNVPLTPSHLIYGASAAEIDALLAQSRGQAA